MEPYEIIISPFEVYLAPVGEAFPAVEDVPAGNWALLGTNGKINRSEDGITVTHNQTLNPHRTDGTTGPVKVTRSEEELLISMMLEDLSLEQYAKALNNVAVSDTPAGGGAAGFRDITLRQGPDVALFALLCRGKSPYGDWWNMQYQVPKVYQNDNPAPVFNKSGAAGLKFTFAALEDLSAATEEERFGKLVAQDSNP
jgi:hypothetical protein